MSIPFSLRPIIQHDRFRAHVRKYWEFYTDLFFDSQQYRNLESVKRNTDLIKSLMRETVKSYRLYIDIKSISLHTRASEGDVVEAIVEFVMYYDHYAGSNVTFAKFESENRNALW